MRTVIAAAIGAVTLLGTSSASAQTLDEPQPHRVYVAAGAGVVGGSSFGSNDATLRGNSATPEPFRLFTADSRMSAAPALDFGVGIFLTPRFAVEGGLKFGQPELRSALSADAEGAPPLTVVERIDQYLIEGTIVVRIDELRLGQRTVPFVAAGAGYLRQLHEGLTVIEEGHLYHVGGGVRHWLAVRRAGIRGVGVRLDARLYVLFGGVTLLSGPRPLGAVSGSLLLAF